MSATVSRRDLFTRFLEPLRQLSRDGSGLTAGAVKASEVAPGQDKVAVIQGRFCIALTSFCSVCVERCPEPGAMTKERGMPMIVADLCTGCGICQEICPAPRNAVLLMPRRKAGSI